MFLTVQHSNDYITICEFMAQGVEVFVPNYDNLALAGSASMSSEGWGGSPTRATDGDTSTSWGEASCTHTQNGEPEWWQVDLGDTYSLFAFNLYHRTDCCQDRLVGAHIWLSAGADYTSDAIECAASTDGGNTDQPETGTCGGARGQFVTVQHSSDYITICEFEVSGTAPATPPQNIITGWAPVQQSQDQIDARGIENGDLRYDVVSATITLDAMLDDWAGVPILARTPFRRGGTVGEDANGATGGGAWCEFDECNGGIHAGIADQSMAFALAWDTGALHLGVKAVDGIHQNPGDGWNDDTLQIAFTNAARDALSGEMILYNYGFSDEDGTMHHEDRPCLDADDCTEGAFWHGLLLCPRHESTRRSAVGRCEKEKDIGKEKPDRRKPKKRR